MSNIDVKRVKDILIRIAMIIACLFLVFILTKAILGLGQDNFFAPETIVSLIDNPLPADISPVVESDELRVPHVATLILRDDAEPELFREQVQKADKIFLHVRYNDNDREVKISVWTTKDDKDAMLFQENHKVGFKGMMRLAHYNINNDTVVLDFKKESMLIIVLFICYIAMDVFVIMVACIAFVGIFQKEKERAQ